MSMKIKIDGSIYEVSKVYGGSKSCLPLLEIGHNGRMSFHVAEDSEEAGAAVAEYYEDLRAHDPREFRAIMGDERLIEWGCGESDSFGISSFEEFKEAVENVPEEHWARYDGNECECEIVPEWADEPDPDYFECDQCKDEHGNKFLHPYSKEGRCLAQDSDDIQAESYTREDIETDEPDAVIITEEDISLRSEWTPEDSDLYSELGFLPTVAYRAN